MILVTLWSGNQSNIDFTSNLHWTRKDKSLSPFFALWSCFCKPKFLVDCQSAHIALSVVPEWYYFFSFFLSSSCSSLHKTKGHSCMDAKVQKARSFSCFGIHNTIKHTPTKQMRESCASKWVTSNRNATHDILMYIAYHTVVLYIFGKQYRSVSLARLLDILCAFLDEWEREDKYNNMKSSESRCAHTVHRATFMSSNTSSVHVHGYIYMLYKDNNKQRFVFGLLVRTIIDDISDRCHHSLWFDTMKNFFCLFLLFFPTFLPLSLFFNHLHLAFTRRIECTYVIRWTWGWVR